MARLDWKVIFKKFLAVAAFLAVVAVLTLALFGAMLPSDWIVVRGVTVDAPPERIFRVFANFKNWDGWNPWLKQDPAMKIRLGPKTRGKGAWQTWESPTMGTGRTEITESARYREVTFHTDIKGSWDSSFNYRIELQPRQDGRTELRWVAFGTEIKLAPKLMAQLLFDRFMGPDIEAALAGIKKIAEAAPDEDPEAEPALPRPRRARIQAAPVPATVEVSTP